MESVRSVDSGFIRRATEVVVHHMDQESFFSYLGFLLFHHLNTKAMKIKKEDLPVRMQTSDTIMRNLPGYGGMTVAFNEMPAGTDVTPLLEGLKNNSCHCPHWGYIVQGVMRVIYDDGTEEVLTTGDVFYLPPGHTAIVEEDVKLIDFNPEKEFAEVMDHIAKKMAELSE